MKHIRLLAVEEQSSETTGYQMVSASQVDANGEWVTDSVRNFETLHKLKDALKNLITPDSPVVIRASNHFDRLATELGLSRLSSEWGRL